MTVKELAVYLDERIPASLSEPWDNDGRMVIPNGDAQVTGVLCALDCTGGAIARAKELGCNVILTHHPLIFKPLASLTETDSVDKRVLACVEGGIAVLSYHTRLDCLEGGVNDCLAKAIGLKNTIAFLPYGRIGEVAEQSFEQFADLVENALETKELALVKATPKVKKVALVSGSGKDEMVRLLKQAMRYLVPSGSANINHGDIESLSAEDFYYYLLSRYRINTRSLKSQSFMLFKIRDSYCLDDDNNQTKGVDFFVIDMSADVKSRIYSFISRFDSKGNRIPYEGCYKILCDYLSSASKNISRVLLDDSYGFSLMDSERTRIVFESSPQSRVFYLLLLKYGPSGVSQETFEQALSLLKEIPDDGSFDMGAFMSAMASSHSDASILIYNASVIYSEISGKEASSRKFLGYIESIFRNRSSLKNYVNKGFSEQVKLADAGLFSISFDQMTKRYSVAVGLQSFRVTDAFGTPAPLETVGFWRRLL